jgi:hypothetical protein
MQELIVLGLVPGTDTYIPFYYWVIAASLVLVLFCLRYKIVLLAYRLLAKLFSLRISHSLKHKHFL